MFLMVSDLALLTPLREDRHVRTMGWPYPFRPLSWPVIGARFHAMADQHPEFRHMADIVDSIDTSGAGGLAAGCTSMHDLIVVTQPIPDPPYDVIAVRSPSSLRPVAAGTVVIEHLATTGRNDRIARPSAEAVRLFWRFMIEKFGIHPTPTGAPPEREP